MYLRSMENKWSEEEEEMEVGQIEIHGTCLRNKVTVGHRGALARRIQHASLAF